MSKRIIQTAAKNAGGVRPGAYMVKREKALRCRECAYRKKYMDEEAQP